MNKEILFTYTEFPEDLVENILNVDPTKKPSQGARRPSQLLGRQFLTPTDDVNAAMQHFSGLLQQLPLPRPADQAVLPHAEKILGKPHQSPDQFLNPVTTRRRNCKFDLAPGLAAYSA